MAKELVDQAIKYAEDMGLMSYPKRSVLLEDIVRCEEKIGYSFPVSFRHFLNVYGFVGIGGTEFYGLISGDLNSSSYLNAYSFNKEMQDEHEFPKELFAFENFEGDAVACLLLSQVTDGECPVVFCDHSELYERQLNNPYVLASSFGAYLLEKTKQIIEDQ